MKIFMWKDFAAREYIVNTFNIDSSYSFPLHSHNNHWEFVYCEKGSFEHHINGKTINQAEGEIIFIRESDSHFLKGKNFKYHNIAFSGAWIESLKIFLDGDILDQTVLRNNVIPRITLPADEREIIQKRIRSLIGNKRGQTQILEFSHFLLYVFDSFLVGKAEDIMTGDLPLWLHELLKFINNREEEVPSLEDVIEKSCKCAEHVSRSFRKYLNLTPSQYLKGVRLKKAADLLRNTNFSVKEVCYYSSYENPNYFHRQFRELYNQTPTEYRADHSRIIH